MKKITIATLLFYKKNVSPFLVSLFGHACRFTPTCSEYTIIALERFGLVKGMVLGLKRFSSCHPWGGFGYDPVPKI